MKKAFGQTVRDLKREVNKKVLKVPSVEQKVLDATSNEPWGPHGTVLADIAQASRNYHDYQMIMSIIWKRINDTGKNWRHVYKALTVLEYMVANGSERVIDDIREHAYQIQTLSDFQYIDSSGRDQGNNVRRKSQSLVVLVNDKERIVEVRQKAAANREKFRNTNSGSMYRAGSYSGSGGFEDERYDGRYGNRDEDRNGYGKEREYGYRDDDRNSRSGDSYGRDGNSRDRDYEDHYNRDGNKDDDSRGRSHSDGYQYGSRSRSSDRDQENSQHSSRGSFATADASLQEGSNFEKRLERKLSEQNIGGPPSYEEVVGAGRSPTYSEQGGENPSNPASYSSPANASPSKAAPSSASQPAFPSPPASSLPRPMSNEKGPDSFDEFDPRGSFSAATASNISAQNSAAEMDLLDSLSGSFSSTSLALVPSGSATEAFGDSGSGISSSSLAKEAFDDPFGDGLFKAIPSTDHLPAQNLNTISTSSYPAASNQSLSPPQMVLQRQGTGNNQGDMFPGVTYAQSSASTPNHDIDVLADILPPAPPQALTSSETSFPPHANDPSSQAGLPLQNNLSVSQTGNPSQTGVHEGSGQLALMSNSVQPGHPFLPAGLQSGQHVPHANIYPQTTQNPSPASFMDPTVEVSQTGFQFHSGQPTYVTNFPVPIGSAPQTSLQQNVNLSGSYSPQQPSTGLLNSAPQPADDKFKTKSTVWADTLSRGLVNLSISGSKTNPLADIGVDFDAINRREKRMEKPTTAPTVSNFTMGKAMGAGSGLGRAGAGVLRPPSTPMMGSGNGMGMGPGMSSGPRPAMGMGGYGAVNQPLGVGMGMNMPPNMGMGGIGQGGQMQRPIGFPPGSTMPGGYNPMSGTGSYGQQPYGGGGYR